jgi:hypothetical protein
MRCAAVMRCAIEPNGGLIPATQPRTADDVIPTAADFYPDANPLTFGRRVLAPSRPRGSDRPVAGSRRPYARGDHTAPLNFDQSVDCKILL